MGSIVAFQRNEREIKVTTPIVSDNYSDQAIRSRVAEPITDRNMIADISDYFISNGKFRNNLLFLIGCNCGLRCGEILSLTWGQLLETDGTVKSVITFIEEKNSKKDAETKEYIKGKVVSRTVYIGDVVREAILLYASKLPKIDLTDFVFKSESRSANYYTELRANGIGAKHNHLCRQSVDKMLKQTIKETLGYMDMHISTHTMRKTFARQVWDSAPDTQKHDVARFLQKMLGHADLSSTLHYIGISQEEMRDTFINLNLGRRTKASAENNIIKLDGMSKGDSNDSLCR